MFTLKSVLVLLLFCVILLSACTPILLTTTAATTSANTIFQERTIRDNVGDKRIWLKIKYELKKHKLPIVSIIVHNKRVLLVGTVKSKQIRARIEEIAWKTRRTKEVMNDISISETDKSIYPVDVLITSEIKVKLLLDKNIKSINYDFLTHDKVVYIVGIAQNDEELTNVTEIVRKIKNVRSVISYIRKKEDTIK